MGLPERFSAIILEGNHKTYGDQIIELLEAVCAERGCDWPAEPITGTGDGDYIKGTTGAGAYKVLRAIGSCKCCGKEKP